MAFSLSIIIKKKLKGNFWMTLLLKNKKINK